VEEAGGGGEEGLLFAYDEWVRRGLEWLGGRAGRVVEDLVGALEERELVDVTHVEAYFRVIGVERLGGRVF